MNRKGALRGLNGLAPQIEKHLAKIAADPDSRDVPHWTREVRSWIGHMEQVLPDVGKKTSQEWQRRIDEWKDKLGM
jgi:hypothetical protein